jgi:hypothetical protein
MPFDPASDEDYRGQRVIGMAAAVLPVSASRDLAIEDLGVLLRSDGAAITLTVPKNLPEGFNCAIADWATGRVTIAAGTGATNRSGTTASSEQYKTLSLIVVKNTGGNAAEFVVGEG